MKVGDITYFLPRAVTSYQVHRLVRRVGGTDERTVTDSFDTASKADTFYKNTVKLERLFEPDPAWEVVQIQRVSVVIKGCKSKRFIWSS